MHDGGFNDSSSRRDEFKNSSRRFVKDLILEFALLDTNHTPSALFGIVLFQKALGNGGCGET